MIELYALTFFKPTAGPGLFARLPWIHYANALNGQLATDLLSTTFKLWLDSNGHARFTRRRSTRGSKQRPTGARKTKSTVPPELRAPMTTEVEQQLRALIRRHGPKKVHDAIIQDTI
jgi:hypothetical protein